MFNTFVLQLSFENELEEIDEMDLCSRFLLPTLQSFFDEQFEERNIFVKLSNNKNKEC
jgi:hypothetical protein